MIGLGTITVRSETPEGSVFSRLNTAVFSDALRIDAADNLGAKYRHEIDRGEAAMNVFKKIRLELRMARRVGEFKRARKAGMSVELARARSDKLLTPDDRAYEEQLREKERQRERTRR